MGHAIHSAPRPSPTPPTERARLISRAVCEQSMRSRLHAMTMRRRIVEWLRANLADGDRLRWSAAMGVSRRKVDRMLAVDHCEQAPVRVDDLLYLPRGVRELLWLVMEQWAGEIERGEL